MIIQKIKFSRHTITPLEHHAPVTADGQAPIAIEITLQGMKPPARNRLKLLQIVGAMQC